MVTDRGGADPVGAANPGLQQAVSGGPADNGGAAGRGGEGTSGDV